MRCVVAATRSWNRRLFNDTLRHYPGTWLFIDKPEALTLNVLEEFRPRYAFFLHWSWRLPPEIVEKFECVGFHMADLPHGRGGSPLQNLVVRGHRTTKLTALRLTPELDAGPIYLKEDLSLEGAAEEIYIRAAALAAKMIRRILEGDLAPVPQVGEPVIFKRRSPGESEIPRRESLQALYDFIRMLDAEGYPRAFLRHQGFRYEFSRATAYEGGIRADVTITPEDLGGGRP